MLKTINNFFIKYLFTYLMLISFLTSCGSKAPLMLTPEQQKEKNELMQNHTLNKKATEMGSVDTSELEREEKIEEEEGNANR